jgi:broad specificity phosphatase PhoE
MATRLVLLCAGATASARAGSFPDPDEPLDDGGREKARALRLDGPSFDECCAAPSYAAIETASLLDLVARPVAALRDVDRGDWAGHGFEAIDQAALATWLAAPDAATPGGESMVDVVTRVAPWLDGLSGSDRRVLAITHPAVIRAALAHALSLPVAATLAIDVPPLAAVALSHHDRWRLQELRRP